MTKLFTIAATVNRMPVTFQMEVTLTEDEMLAALKQKATDLAVQRGFAAPTIQSFQDTATQLELIFEEEESESEEYTRYTPAETASNDCQDVSVDSLTGRPAYTPYGSQQQSPSPFTPLSHHQLIPGTDYTPYRSFVVPDSE